MNVYHGGQLIIEEYTVKLIYEPCTAAIASMVVRIMLFSGCDSVREYPEVWQCALSRSDRGSLGLNFSDKRVAHSFRPARSFAICSEAMRRLGKYNTNHNL